MKKGTRGVQHLREQVQVDSRVNSSVKVVYIKCWERTPSTTTIDAEEVVTMVSVHLIRTEGRVQGCFGAAEQLMDAEAGTSRGDELEHLAMVIEASKKSIIDRASRPIAAIQFRMEQEGLMNKDLSPFIGRISQGVGVLSGKRTDALDDPARCTSILEFRQKC